MELLNCSVCGRLFKSHGATICNRCSDEEEGDSPYKKVKEYICTHYGANVFEVSEATGVPVNLILKFMKDGRVSIIE